MTARTELDPDRAWLAALTVLCVEDDDDARALLGHFLRRRVGRLVEAADGAEALARFHHERPSLVITDIRMPGHLDGLALAAEIRRLDAGVPIVVTTAFEQVDYLRRAVDVGIHRYVTKPIDTDELDAVLLDCARALRARALREAAQQRELEWLRARQREALGLLAGGMSHDFNNLVQVVLLNLDVAVPLVEPGTDLCELLEGALDAARQARELSHWLMAFHEGWPAQLSEGPIEPTLRRALEKALQGSDTALRLDLNPGVAAVVHDDELLGRAFAQLAVNAREAMRERGALHVACTMRRLADAEVAALPGGRYVEVVFRDSGPGVAPENLPRLFDPYFSTKARGAVRGMGLGLALCRAILRKHGGSVVAASTPGEGAEFTVLLPAVERAA